MRRWGILVVIVLSWLGPAQATPGGRVPVELTVTNLSEGGAPHVLRGYRIDAACDASTVVVLQHGLSYTSGAWDVPGHSYARALAEAGYAVVAFDRLGYGDSPLEDGNAVSTVAYHDMAAQVVAQLRADYDHVVLGGHSAGGEASEGAVGTYGGADALMVLGYHHFPSPELVAEFVTGDSVRATTDDYEYFLGTPEARAEWFYGGDYDPSVVEADTAAAVLTPSGEIRSIGPQPSRVLQAGVTVPVFLQLAELDRLFPVEYAPQAAASFVQSPSVTVDVVPAAGHTFMLHAGGVAAAQRAADWLRAQPATPSCAG